MLSISTKNSEPNTKLTKSKLLELEDRLDENNNELSRNEILDVAITLRDNTLSSFTENELDRMIYMIKEEKGNLREIKSILLRSIMMAIPTSGGNKKRHTLHKKKTIKRITRNHKRHTKRK